MARDKSILINYTNNNIPPKLMSICKTFISVPNIMIHT